MIYPVKIPQINVNEEKVRVVSWYVKEGGRVNKGDPLCCIETSKAAVDLPAERAGYVKGARYAVGDEVKINAVVCFIADSPKDKIPSSHLTRKPSRDLEGKEALATHKARVLAEELGVSLDEIRIKGIIRQKDVLDFYRSGKPARDDTKAAEACKDMPLDFLHRLSSDEEFKCLSSEEKISLYKANGATIGDRVVLGKGSVIIAKRIHIADEVQIGDNVYIEADELRLGRMVSIGKDSSLVSGAIYIGEVTTIAEGVTFDLSGGKNRSSRVIIGSQCLIASDSYLNSARTIKIGNYVALSPRAMVYTHSYWQSVLQGYYADFEGVDICDNAWIGSSSQILPGVSIGEGSIVISNSLVNSSVLPNTMVGGVPAVIVKRGLKKDLSREAKNKILASLIGEFVLFLQERGCRVERDENRSRIKYTVHTPQGKGRYKILLWLGPCGVDSTQEEVIHLGLRFVNRPKKGIVFDIAARHIYGKENVISYELRNFLRRRGIVFSPIYWRYDFKKGL